MCDDQYASPSCGSRFELGSDDSHVCGIQAACRLVEDKDVAIGEKRAGNRQALALTSRQAGRVRIAVLVEPHSSEDVTCPPDVLLATLPHAYKKLVGHGVGEELGPGIVGAEPQLPSAPRGAQTFR